MSPHTDTHSHSHSPGQLIRSSDWDRSLQLIREGIEIPVSALQGVLDGSIELNDMDPSLQALILRSVSAINSVEQSFIGDGLTTTFTLTAAPVAGTERVFLNGQRVLGGGSDFTLSGLDVIFTIAPKLGDVIVADYTTGTATIDLTILGSYSIPERQIITPIPTMEPINNSSQK